MDKFFWRGGQYDGPEVITGALIVLGECALFTPLYVVGGVYGDNRFGKDQKRIAPKLILHAPLVALLTVDIAGRIQAEADLLCGGRVFAQDGIIANKRFMAADLPYVESGPNRVIIDARSIDETGLGFVGELRSRGLSPVIQPLRFPSPYKDKPELRARVREKICLSRCKNRKDAQLEGANNWPNYPDQIKDVKRREDW